MQPDARRPVRLRSSEAVMTSREIVGRAVHRRRPPRLPVRFAALGEDDTGGIPIKPAANFSPRTPGEDEWGCIWSKTELANMGQVKGHPIKHIDQLAKHRVPDYDDDTRYEDVPAALDGYEREGRYVLAGIFMVLFERMHSLYGLERALCDLLTDRSAMEALADRIVDVHLRFVENVRQRFGKRVHGITMTDDWGTQQAAFVSMELWNDFFLPRYKRLFEAIRTAGYDVWVHSCGKVNEIIAGFIQAGTSVINLQQPRALGIEQIGRRYRGRIAFESLADIQQTLPTNDKERVEQDVEALMEHWALPEGGFVLSDYGDGEAIGVTNPAIKLHMYRCFSQHSERIYGQPLPEPKPA